MFATVLLAGACLCAGESPSQAGPAGDASREWHPVGLSGSGGMFAPAISPADPDLMMLNCDMSGAYRSLDGGRTWRMIHHGQLRSYLRCRPAFHPTDPNVVFAAAGWAGRLKVSRDRGEHWQEIGDLPPGLVGEIALDPGQPARMLAGVKDGLWMSADGGKAWRQCRGPRGEAVGFHFDQTGPAGKRVCFAATAEGVWRSDDGGETWAGKSSGLPGKGIRSFAGGSEPGGKLVVLYCAVPSRDEGGKLVGGVFRSADRGESWESAMGAGINADVKPADSGKHDDVAQYHVVLASNAAPRTVYALNSGTGSSPPHHATVFRSEDSGGTWRATFFPDPRTKEFNVAHDYEMASWGCSWNPPRKHAAVSASDPNRVLCVAGMSCFLTSDGGKSWACGHTRPAAGQAPTGDANWLCNGLVVTSAWHYYVDPFESSRHYIAYTDIGFARSLDGGKTWRWWGGRDKMVPWAWRNTCYELAFDPQTPGRMWGAFTDVHDVPNANAVMGHHRTSGPGGICLSTDFGASWKPSSQGLPDAPATSVVLDPKGPPGSRTLYAGFFGNGVYRSADDGKTWTAKSRRLGSPANMRVCRVQLHPDGTLFALVTGNRKDGRLQAEGVGLYRSRDGAENWELANRAQPLLWPKDFAFDPKDSRVILIGACDANGKEEGGLYRTADGGATWKRLARQGKEHFGAYLHPKRPGWIYMTLCEGAPGAGLWLSRDGGETWGPINGLPFGNVQRVEFDPADDSFVYVTTFGGSVWKGPAGP